MKGEGIVALGEFDEELILGTFGRVVLGQFRPETPSLDAHHGVHMRVEVLLPAEDFGRNLILLGGGTRVIPGVIGEIAQELAEGLGAMKSMATEEPVDLNELLGFLCHGSTGRGL